LQLLTVYEHVLNLRFFGRGIEWQINGVPFRIDARYRRQMGQEYDRDLAPFFHKEVKPGFLCWDIGANVGVYVLQLANWSGPDGRLVAFEPNPATVAVLRKHVKMNGLENRVTIVPEAVGEIAGIATLHASACDGMSRLGKPNKLLPGTKSISVPITKLDDFVAHNGEIPNLILIDIEGFEFGALAGARRLLTEHRNIGIIVELHPNAWDSAGMDRQKAARLLEELRLKPVALTGQQDPLGEYGHVQLTQY
jgi:FkbM family methyltransferase